MALCVDENKMTTPTATRKTYAFFFTGLDQSRLTNLDRFRSRLEKECSEHNAASCWSIVHSDLFDNAQNAIDMFPHRHGSWQLVADTANYLDMSECRQEVCNKSANHCHRLFIMYSAIRLSSRKCAINSVLQQVVETEFGK